MTYLDQIEGRVVSQAKRLGAPNVTFRTFYLCVVALYACLTVAFLAQAIRFLPVRGDNMYPESAGVLSAQRYASGLPLYEDYRQPPHLTTSFPPLWFEVMAIPAKFGATSLDSLTYFGRVLSLACLFVAVLTGYLWNRSMGLASGMAILTPLCYLSLPQLIPWGVTARPDFPALAACIGALCLVGYRSRGIFLVAGSVLAACGFLVRHNSVAAPVAIVVWLLLAKRVKDAALFCAVWAVVVFPVLAWFQVASHGMLLTNLSGAKFGAMSVSYIRDIVANMVNAPGSGCGVLLWVFGSVTLLDLRSIDRGRLLSWLYATAAISFAVIGAAAAGAAANHFLEPSLAMAVLAPWFFRRGEEEWPQGSVVGLFSLVVAVSLLAPSLDVQRANVSHREAEDMRKVASVTSRRHMFSDIPYLAARASVPGLIDLASLVNTERRTSPWSWSSESLVEDLKRKRYEVVALSTPIEQTILPDGLYPRAPRMDTKMQHAIAENYELCGEIDKVYLYVGRGDVAAGAGGVCAGQLLRRE
jgi:hypothetical protein